MKDGRNPLHAFSYTIIAAVELAFAILTLLLLVRRLDYSTDAERKLRTWESVLVPQYCGAVVCIAVAVFLNPVANAAYAVTKLFWLIQLAFLAPVYDGSRPWYA